MSKDSKVCSCEVLCAVILVGILVFGILWFLSGLGQGMFYLAIELVPYFEQHPFKAGVLAIGVYIFGEILSRLARSPALPRMKI